MNSQPDKRTIYLTDRSAVETDDQCGMKFWWNRKAGPGGKGIVPVKEQLALMVGRETHQDLATIAMMEDIGPAAMQAMVDDVLSGLTEDDRQDQEKMEILYRRLGWAVAFALYIEPKIREKYETLQIEGELVLDRDPLWVAATPDRILRDRADKTIVYREYKSTISSSQKWLHSWLFAIQLHIGLAAVGEELEEKAAFGQIMGLMKGYESGADKRLVHPYVWGWYNANTGAWVSAYSDARAAGWEPMPVWEYEGGLVAWVLRCGPEVAAQQFPHTQPVFLNEKILSEWVTRRLARERILRSIGKAAETNLNIRNTYFEKRTRNCRPAFGEACPYLMCCWNATIEADPLAGGQFVPRQPHHDVEIVGVE